MAASMGSSSKERDVYQSLIRYYQACIKGDQSADISFYANQFKSPEWVEASAGPDLSLLGEDDLVERIASIADLAAFVSGGSKMSRASYFYGFPIFATAIYSNKTKTSYVKVEPLFFLKLEREFHLGKTKWTFSDDLPEVNHAALKSIAPNPEEAREFVEQLGLMGEEDFAGTLSDLASKVEAILGADVWKEPFDPANLICDGRMAGKFEPGLYNRGMLFKTELSSFTKGLEKELLQLEGEGIEKVLATALGTALAIGPDKVPGVWNDTMSLSNAIELNENQEKAVKSALTNPWTVITGPPGTGKSQVVSAILVNAALNGKSVLFASRNHKAVDVVVERTNKLVGRPLLLKLGRQSGDQKGLSEYIANLLAQSPTEKMVSDKLEVAAEINEVRSMRTVASRKIAALEDLLNKTQEVENDIEKYRPILGEEFSALKTCQAKSELNGFMRFIEKIEILDQFLRMAPFAWRFASIRRAMVKPLEKQRVFCPEISKKICFDTIDFSSLGIEEVKALRDRSKEFLSGLNVLVRFSEIMEKLKEIESLESIEVEITDLTDELVVKGVKFLELWSKCLAAGLKNEERKALSEYRAALDTISDANLPKAYYWKLAKEMDAAFSIVSRYIPGWCVTNLSARGRVPFNAGMFDLVVIDEASQCDIPSALPLLFRAKKAVIIGDPNQLQHITQMRPSKDLELRHKNGLDGIKFEPFGYSRNSLFALAQSIATQGGVVELNDHHRSHADIIGFSNRRFYGDRLSIVTDYRKLIHDNGFLGIQWKDVQGRAVRPGTGGAVNEIEAKEVAEQVVALIKNRGYSGTVGVTTPFRIQANRIRDLVAQRLSPSEIEAHDLIIDVVHRYQGDERDCMFFSPVVSEGIHEKSLGFLRSTGNLFNVAMTRARSVLIVVGDQKACLNCGVDHLEKFVVYAMGLKSSAARENAWSKDAFDSEWEERLYRRLVQEGFSPKPQYQIGQYRLDLALEAEGVLLDVEVDGERYHKDWTGNLRQRDLVRNKRLQEQGWVVERFWVYQVRDDLDYCVKRVREALMKSA